MIPWKAWIIAAVLPVAAFVFPGSAMAGTITATGEALVTAIPDEVVITLNVETRDINLAVARKDNEDRVQRVLQCAQRNGVDDRYIQADFISIEPRYTCQQAFLGYFVKKTIAITLQDLPAFEKIISDLMEVGANHVDGTVQFRTTELGKYQNQARAMAIKAAVEKAANEAAALGQKVGRAQKVEEPPLVSWSSYTSSCKSRMSPMPEQSVQIVRAGPGMADQIITPRTIGIGAKLTVTFDME